MRALPPIPGFSGFFPATPIVLDLTNASMIYKIQNPRFPQVQPLETLGNKIQILGQPIQIGLKYHQYMEVMEKGTKSESGTNGVEIETEEK